MPTKLPYTAASAEGDGTTTTTSIRQKAAVVLDEALDSLRTKIREKGAGANDLRELLALAKACKLDLSSNGQPLSLASERVRDDVLASMAGLDLDRLQ